MQMVAASKMRRAQEKVLAARPYAEKLRSVLGRLTAQGAAETDLPHALLEVRPLHNVLVLEVTPDRGLCGGLPGNINRRTGQFMLSQEAPTAVVTVGRKGRDFMVRTGRDLKASFTGIGERPALSDTVAISALLARMYTEGEADEVHVAYTRYVNTLVQEPVVARLLPVEPGEFEGRVTPVDYLYEPDPAAVFGALLPRYLEMQVYHAFLEADASEQSARMVAMRNATEAADEMIETLTLDMNKARQNMITAELLDLVGGVAALEG